MRRIVPPSLVRAKLLAQQSRRVFVALGEPRKTRSGCGRWRLRVPLLGGLDHTPSADQLRIATIRRDRSIAAARLRPVSVERDGELLTVLAEQRDAELGARSRLFLVTVDPPSTSALELSERLDHSASDARGHALAGLNYLTREYGEFRSLLLDRLSTFDPSWTDRNPADLGVMLAEVLAYLADDLAYYQDAVATEAYLTTARRRMSVHRHARLLEYWVDDGAGARVWVRFTADQQITIPASTALLAATGGPAIVKEGTFEDAQLRARTNLVFETVAELTVYPGLGRIPIIDRSGRRGLTIPAGTTELEVEDVPLAQLTTGFPSRLRMLAMPDPNAVAGAEPVSEPESDVDAKRLSSLDPGYILVFETRSELDVPAHPVRIVECTRVRSGANGVPTVRLRWDPADAPTQPLPVSAVIDGTLRRDLTVLTGNVTLADFGESQYWLLPPYEDPSVRYRPALPASVVPLVTHEWRKSTPAAAAVNPPANLVRPAIRLTELRDARALAGRASLEHAQRLDDTLAPASGTGTVWQPVPDLLLSQPFSRSFVVEAEPVGATLRFGDGVFGRPPPLGSMFLANVRVGDPSQSNVGIGVISTVVAPPDIGDQKPFEEWAEARLCVDNPTPAMGGRAPESLATAKRAATALANQINASLTLADCRMLAHRVVGVADVATIQRWTGSWLTTFVHVRASEATNESTVLTNVARELELGRVAGREIIVRPPDWVPLAVHLRITLADGFGREGVRAALRLAFFRAPSSRWGPGFFHPSRWSFGETVWASAITTWARGVAGVAAVELVELARLRDRPTSGRAAPMRSTASPAQVRNALTMAASELPSVSDDPGDPERGFLRLDFADGLELRCLTDERELTW